MLEFCGTKSWQICICQVQFDPVVRDANESLEPEFHFSVRATAKALPFLVIFGQIMFVDFLAPNHGEYAYQVQFAPVVRDVDC